MEIALGWYREGQLLSLLEFLLLEIPLLQEHRPTRIYSRAANLSLILRRSRTGTVWF